MGSFVAAAVAYPTAIYSTLLGVVLVYWLLAIVGLVDIEADGLNVEVGHPVDGELPELGAAASFMAALGLAGVPMSLSASLLVLFGWMFSCLAGMWLLPLVPAGGLQLLAGSGVLLGSALLALPPAWLSIRPLRSLFTTREAARHVSLVGTLCTVRTLAVDDRHGQAEVETGGAVALINVRAGVPNSLTRGSVARILHYDVRLDRYDIRPEIQLRKS